MERVFIVGSPRSGTTLLNSILWTSDSFAIYRAETLLLTVCPRVYGDLRGDGRYRRFLTDWYRSRQFHRSGLDRDEFESLARSNRASYPHLLTAFMDAVACKQGRPGWIDSTPENAFHLQQIAESVPRSKVIHIVRDGRAVAASRRRLGWVGVRTDNPSRQLLFAGLSWERAVNAARHGAEALGDRYRELRFESLLTEPARALRELSEYLDVPLTVEAVAESKLGSLGEANSAFDRSGSGVDASYVSRWRESLGQEDISMLDAVLGPTLGELGYETSPVASGLWPWKGRLARGYLALRSLAAERTPLGRLTGTSLELDKD